MQLIQQVIQSWDGELVFDDDLVISLPSMYMCHHLSFFGTVKTSITTHGLTLAWTNPLFIKSLTCFCNSWSFAGFIRLDSQLGSTNPRMRSMVWWIFLSGGNSSGRLSVRTPWHFFNKGCIALVLTPHFLLTPLVLVPLMLLSCPYKGGMRCQDSISDWSFFPYDSFQGRSIMHSSFLVNECVFVAIM